jgi:hypothetical protein
VKVEKLNSGVLLAGPNEPSLEMKRFRCVGELQAEPNLLSHKILEVAFHSTSPE